MATGEKQSAIRYTLVDLDPIGQVFVGFTDAGLCYLTTGTSEADLVAEVGGRYGCDLVRDDSGRDRWRDLLNRWLNGNRVEVRLDLSRVTDFDRLVMAKTREIPRGAVRPYLWLAREIGKPGASRAIGGVMARNPIPLIIPCHRVVAASGLIGNYSMGGPEVKRRLLEIEGVDVERMTQLARRGYRFKGSETTRIFCYPTCREIQPEHEMLFRTAREAEQAGFRPCKICRPG